MRNWMPRIFNGVNYVNPKDELQARVDKAKDMGDEYAAIPIEVIEACLSMKECEARTIVNGDRVRGILVEVKCTRPVDPVTGKHVGMHVNGKTNWW